MASSLSARLVLLLSTVRSGGWRLLVLAGLGLYACAGIYSVSTDQQAVVVRFGRIVESRVPAGVHWTWPPPIGEIYRLRVRETKRLTLGFDDSQPLAASQFLTGDRNILNIRLVVQYAINDPTAYLFRTVDINAAIANVARSALVQAVAERQVDDLLTTGKVAVQQRVQMLADAALTRYGCGVSLLGVVLDAIQPPADVVDAFRRVSSAREDSNRIVREAESYANGVVPVARGNAAKLLEEAQAYQSQRVNDAIGDASRFTAVAAEFERAPTETSTRLYLEVMEEVLPKMDKTVMGADGKSIDLQFIRIK